ncbi:DUF6298 domain-containing protein [Novipirellula artificiosorum]|uniref:DUF6298 domain-containing protein n=1 Tax=Novipirellula artificiosorum TaxID=2528016 RepID=A0A5C6E529_9BACT|nr:DUF6298 domain-containing protein [Novipirellula artificiosorum]TWU42691.1 hypothetical protein Poly41_09910 [Novipirellula artificiosorum]
MKLAVLNLCCLLVVPSMLSAAPPNAAGMVEKQSVMGPLVVHAGNGRYFATPDGKPVWLTGSHTWATLQERGIEGETPAFDYEQYLGFMQHHDHNFLRLWAWEHSQWMQFVDSDVHVRYKPTIFQRTGPGVALDGAPKFDLTKFNPEFFQRLRERVEEARKRNIYVSVMFFQGFSVKKPPASPRSGNNWHGNPFNKLNNINGIDGDPSGRDAGHELHTLLTPDVTRVQEAYVRRVIDTLNDLENVLWEIGNELPASSVEFQYHMVDSVREYESSKAKQHLIGMTGAPVKTAELMASGADWISPPGSVWTDNPPPCDGNKIIVVDTDHCRAMKYDPDWVWINFTRGNHFILMDSYMDFRVGSPKQPDPKWNPTRDAMGAARRLSEQLDLSHMKPLPELASSGFCLADPGTSWVVFHPGGDSLSVQTGRGRWRATWLDPITGKAVSHRDVDSAEVWVSFKPPRPGRWVMLVTKSLQQR